MLGVSAASASLAQLTLRRPVARALDLGTGCGVQSLHLARHADEVVATDLNPRALDLARITFALNGTTVDLRLGDLYQPVAGERFDLIATNPPYVMSPPSDARLTYREGNAPGDALVERVVVEGAAHLAEDGVLQVLGSWAHVRGQDWTDRVGGWVAATGCDAHVVQREVLDPYAYVEVWLADAGLTGSPAYARALCRLVRLLRPAGHRGRGAGLADAAPHRAYAVGPDRGLAAPGRAAHRPGAGRRSVRGRPPGRDDRRADPGHPVAAGRRRGARRRPAGRATADPEHLVFRQQRGFRRAVALDTATAGILGACDGELTLGRIVDVGRRPARGSTSTRCSRRQLRG